MALTSAQHLTKRCGRRIDLANGLGTNLIVCHVVPELDTVNILFPQFADRNAEHRQTLIEKALAAVERQVATRLGDARV